MSEEMGHAYAYMSHDMGMKLGHYYESLQSRYGDPRVYAMEQERMASEQAAVAHAHATTRAEALSHAYEKTRVDVRKTHDLKMADRQAKLLRSAPLRAPRTEQPPFVPAGPPQGRRRVQIEEGAH